MRSGTLVRHANCVQRTVISVECKVMHNVPSESSCSAAQAADSHAQQASTAQSMRIPPNNQSMVCMRTTKQACRLLWLRCWLRVEAWEKARRWRPLRTTLLRWCVKRDWRHGARPTVVGRLVERV